MLNEVVINDRLLFKFLSVLFCVVKKIIMHHKLIKNTHALADTMYIYDVCNNHKQNRYFDKYYHL